MIYTELTNKAMRIAYDAHRGQVDKAGQPYIFHPFHLAEQMKTEYETCAALLHDVAEDTCVSIDELSAEFPAEVTEALRLLTHEEGTDYFDYVRALKDNPIAKAVKLADLEHNMDETRFSGCENAAPGFRREKYRKAAAILAEKEEPGQKDSGNLPGAPAEEAAQEKQMIWLAWARELQAMAQAGLYYTKDVFDKVRYERIREIAAEIVSLFSEISVERVEELFCSDSGYQTPKLDSRAAIFRDDQILLVQERSRKWSLPGGWVDANVSVYENVVKEAKEESGLNAVPELVIAVQDREKHNLPVYAHKVIKIFVLCKSVGGQFQLNSETLASGYFSLDSLPELAEEKNTKEQIRMCFDAYHAENWKTLLD